MGQVLTLLELHIGRLLSMRTVAAEHPNEWSVSHCGGGAAGAPFSSLLSSLTSSTSCGAGVGAGVVGPGVVFGEATWTLSSVVDHWSGNTGMGPS